MSKELVARALEILQDHNFGAYIGGGHREAGDNLAALIRAVDAQYPEGYDDGGGFIAHDFGGYLFCAGCLGEHRKGHKPDCDRWNTRVALLALCRDITGEKE